MVKERTCLLDPCIDGNTKVIPRDGVCDGVTTKLAEGRV